MTLGGKASSTHLNYEIQMMGKKSIINPLAKESKICGELLGAAFAELDLFLMEVKM